MENYGSSLPALPRLLLRGICMFSNVRRHIVLTTYMLIFGYIIVKSKNLYFYTLSEQTPIIAIINNEKGGN